MLWVFPPSARRSRRSVDFRPWRSTGEQRPARGKRRNSYGASACDLKEWGSCRKLKWLRSTNIFSHNRNHWAIIAANGFLKASFSPEKLYTKSQKNKPAAFQSLTEVNLEASESTPWGFQQRRLGPQCRKAEKAQKTRCFRECWSDLSASFCDFLFLFFFF